MPKLVSNAHKSYCTQTHGLEGLNNMFCVYTEVLWGKIKQLISNIITPLFQLNLCLR